QSGEDAWEKDVLDLFFPPQTEYIAALDANAPLPNAPAATAARIMPQATIGATTIVADTVPEAHRQWWNGLVASAEQTFETIGKEIEGEVKHVETATEVKLLAYA